MSVHRFHAIALTPVHVGDGTTWTPESFKLDGRDLVLFEPAAALAALDADGRKAFTRAIDAGDLRKAQALLHGGAGPQVELGRIAVSDASREEIAEAISNPGRAGKVHPFVRSAGRPYLPGSSLKGAIRTAILSARAQRMLPRLQAELARADIRPGRTGRISDMVQRQVLELADGQRATDTDPFRHVALPDCELPRAATRIERVYNLRRDGQPNEMQMHFESLLAGTRFVLDVALADERVGRAAKLDASKTARQPVGIDEFRAALDGFYRAIWDAEARRFHAASGLPHLPPSKEAILLRVGRFSHFEAASIDGLRRGHRPQSRTAAVAAEGSTRMVTRAGERKVPFGWIALFADKDAADSWAKRSVAVTPPRGTGAPRPAQVPAAAFRKGNRVESREGEIATVLADVPLGTPRMDVEFEDGSTETVSIDGWKRA